MKKIISLFCFFPFILGAQTTVVESIEHDGKNRNYTLYFPASYDNNTEEYALVFNFHGFTSNGDQQRLYSQMDRVADTAKLVVCYPEGIGNAWNVGWDFGSTEDDVGFTSAMIDKFISEYRINSKMVYACGMSNGGFFSYKLACELNNKIAAIASVTGSMVPGQENNCFPGRAVPILEIHGTADGVVPYGGSNDVALPITEVVDFWVNNNGCAIFPELFNYPNTSTTDNSTASVERYRECNDDVKVDFITIENGGHTWPDGLVDIGTTNRDINASQVIWEFFMQFELNDEVSSIGEPNILDGVSLFPNPSSGKILINNLPKNSKLDLFTIEGRYILHKLSINTSETFELDKGMYIFRIQNAESTKQFFTIIE